MNISEPFIRRPVATTLLTIGVLLAGLFAFLKLPVSPLPQVDFPDHLGPGADARRQPRDHGHHASRRRWSGISAPSPTSPR